MRKNAFSLIELMVVIAIIAILAAISVPVYKQYTIRVNIDKALVLMESLATDLAAGYGKTGNWPASINLGGTTYGANGWSYAGFQNINSIYYGNYIGNGSVYGDGKGAALGIIISGLEGIPNYITPTVGQQYPNSNTTGANTVYFGIREINGVFNYVCGAWNNSAGQTPPFLYLPSKCSCADVQDYVMFGTPC